MNLKNLESVKVKVRDFTKKDRIFKTIYIDGVFKVKKNNKVYDITPESLDMRRNTVIYSKPDNTYHEPWTAKIRMSAIKDDADYALRALGWGRLKPNLKVKGSFKGNLFDIEEILQ